MAETASTAQNMDGDKLYQQRARKALPILARQASAEAPIYYENLAQELGMPNPRNLNYVLGSIGVTLEQLAKRSNTKIPPIQSLVINQAQGIPGAGFDEFLAEQHVEYGRLLPRQKKRYLKAYWAKDIYPYDWNKVLKELHLEPLKSDLSDLLNQASVGAGGGGGEGPEHRALKEYVSQNPQIVGLPAQTTNGQMEYPLPSGDRIDVVFRYRNRIVAAEVKSSLSNDVDITRGLFQCVKYRAVIEARDAFEATDSDVEAILILGRAMPKNLVPLRNQLGVRVIEGVAH